MTKDLTQEAPSSPRVRVGGYAILSRMTDKGRAQLAGKAGGYHFDCPLDNYLLGFKGVTGDEVKKLLEAGSNDEEIATWLDANGVPKTQEEITAWSDGLEAARPYDNPDKKDWFIGVCAEAGIDPATSTLFDYLEADDHMSFVK
jgi:Domain of unknown function (DUF5069)